MCGTNISPGTTPNPVATTPYRCLQLDICTGFQASFMYLQFWGGPGVVAVRVMGGLWCTLLLRLKDDRASPAA